MDPQTLSNLAELAYSKYVAYYNKKNWVSNLPNWGDLTENDQTFWKDFVKGIRQGFKSDPATSKPHESSASSNE